jgi:hypothetical protein
MHLEEELLRHEVDTIIGRIIDRIADQRRYVDQLRSARKPVREAKRQLMLLNNAFTRLRELRRRFYTDA